MMVISHPYYTPRLPVLRNYFSHERLWGPLAARIVAIVRTLGDARETVIHAQHVRTIPAAVLAGKLLDIPVIATVRDHWPWDYFATGLHGNRFPYPGQLRRKAAWAALLTDLPARMGPLRGILASVAIPYMVAHLRRRTSLLAQSDTIVAVSHYIAQKLHSIIHHTPIQVIPNMVDVELIEDTIHRRNETSFACAWLRDLPARYLLYVGKLEPNKGALLLGDLAHHLRALATEPIPELVIVGDGSCRDHIAQALASFPVRFLSWVPHDDVLLLMQRCTLLLFPSNWGEPLSRVLLEACAVGAPILAMPTGGTEDIIVDGQHGALERTLEGMARRLLWLLHHPEVCTQMGRAARHLARQRFSTASLIPRYEQLYTQLLGSRHEWAWRRRDVSTNDLPPVDEVEE